MQPPVCVGRIAPNFEVLCTSGSEPSRHIARLHDYRDRWLILMFYPRDFSLVCPTELSAIDNRYEEFVKRGTDVLAISTDQIESHERWISTPKASGGLGLIKFPLGSDPSGEVARVYNVCVEPQCVALRALIIIDPNSVVQYQVVHNMSVGRRTGEILRVLTGLQHGGMCPENWAPGQEPMDPAVELSPGSVISHYRIEEKVGAGAFATVFLAYDKALERRVALKVLKRTQQGPFRTENEARAAAALNHPNVCTIHNVDDSEGIPIIVMEYLIGRPLAKLMDDGPLPAETVIDIGRQMAAGMSAAHEAGVVHGDLKPANIMLTDKGAVKILDFGLAGRHRVDQSGDSTLPLGAGGRGTIAGTPAYMSPEQACGAPASTASDVFSFGLIIYEMLAGKRSFGEMNILQILEQTRSTDYGALTVGVGEPFGSLLRRMLTRDPAARTITMQEIENALNTIGSRRC